MVWINSHPNIQNCLSPEEADANIRWLFSSRVSHRAFRIIVLVILVNLGLSGEVLAMVVEKERDDCCRPLLVRYALGLIIALLLGRFTGGGGTPPENIPFLQ